MADRDRIFFCSYNNSKFSSTAKYYFAKCECSSLKLSAFLHNPIKTKFSILLPYTTTIIDIYFSSENTLVPFLGSFQSKNKMGNSHIILYHIKHKRLNTRCFKKPLCCSCWKSFSNMRINKYIRLRLQGAGMSE